MGKKWRSAGVSQSGDAGGDDARCMMMIRSEALQIAGALITNAAESV